MMKPKGISLKSIQLLKSMRYVTVRVVGVDGKSTMHQVDVRKELRMPDDLQKVLRDHPQQVFYWNHCKQGLISKLRKAERNYQSVYNRYYLAYRTDRKGKETYVSDQYIKAEAETHQEVEKAQDRVDKIRDQLGILTAICDALDHRRSMIVQRSQQR